MTDPRLPSGTVTFLFTDIEGSTRAWDTHPDQMREWLAHHDEILRESIDHHDGVVFKHTGDGVCAAFATANDAIEAALGARQRLHGHAQSDAHPRVRMALHSGAAHPENGDYFGPPLNRCARLLGVTHGGQIVCSHATADLARDALPRDAQLRDLGEHRLRDLPGTERVHEVRRNDDDEQFPPLRSEQAPDRLPRARTSFIGRVSAVNELCELLKRERLVTLVGTGGAGKTRLALHVAALAQPDFSDGAYWIDLTATDDPDRVPALVAESVGAPNASGQRAEEDLCAYLAPRVALVVVDNCEHVLDASATTLDTVLRSCPNIVVLVTSREPLRISGEHVWGVPPLAVGDPTSGERGDAVELFLDRAERVGATVAEVDIPTVTEICAHLDGIPLAIELAAARMRHLTPSQILSRLSDRFALLQSGGRDADERHRTLRATLDWSHDLLDERERILFRRLAVFAADVDLEVVEGVCSGDGLEDVDVLDVLSSLVDRSLVAMRGGRYTTLETVHEYATEQLTAADEVNNVHARLCGWFLDRTREQFQPDDVDTFMSLSHPLFRDAHTLANLRVAIEWAFAHDKQAARALVAHTWRHFTSYWHDLVPLWLSAIGDDLGDLKPKEQGSIMAARANICMIGGEMSEAFDLAQDVIDFAERERLPALIPRALVTQGIAAQASRRGDPEALFVRALATADAHDDRPARGDALVQLGEYILHQGRWSEADGMLAEGRLLADENDRIWAYVSGAAVALMLGEHSRALSLADDAVAVMADYPTWLEYARLVYAMAAAALGDEREARHLVEPTLAALLRYRTPLVLGDALVFAAGVAHLCGDNLRAATLLGAARAEFGRTNSWRRPLGGAMYVYFVPRVRLALEPDTYERARAEGLAMTADQAVAITLRPGD